MYNRKLISICAAMLFFLGACDVLQQTPSGAVPSDQIFTSENNVRAVLAGAYSGLQDYVPMNYRFAELAGDDAQHTGSYPSWAVVDGHQMLASNAEARELWQGYYEIISRVNNLIAFTPGVNVTGFSNEEKANIIAEAKIIRALTYHTLVRWFGGVPLVLEPIEGVTEEIFVARAARDSVYTQIISDLTGAVTTLGANGSKGATTATGYAAKALLSRVYLYTRQYDLAEQAATDVINSDVYSLPDDYVANWGATASASPTADEVIWKLAFTSEDDNALAFYAYPSDDGGRREYGPTQGAINSYEAGDERFAANIKTSSGENVLGKYFRVTNGDDDVIIIRLAEVYLNRAEARAQQQPADVTNALADVNVVRNRAGLGDATAATQEAVLEVILEERRHELHMEGHRFFDLRRFGVAQTVLNIDNADNLLWPIPQSEMEVNPALEGNQNPGY